MEIFRTEEWLSKTMGSRSEHVAKVLKREDTVPEAARAAVEDLKLRVSFQS